MFSDFIQHWKNTWTTYKKDILYVFGIVLLSKIFIFGVIFTSRDSIQFSTESYKFGMFKNRIYTEQQLEENKNNGALPFLMTPWDSQWYTYIAERGYQSVPQRNGYPISVAFLPMYPMTIHMVSFLTTLSSEWSGLLIANICTFLWAFFLFLLIAEDWKNKKLAYSVVSLMLISPFAIYFSGAYTESLFLSFFISGFYASRRGWWPLAALLGMLAALTKLQGLILAPIIFLDIALHYKERHGRWTLSPILLWSIFPVVAAASYYLYVWHITGDPLGYVHAQQNIGVPRIFGIGIWNLIKELLGVKFIHSSSNSFIDAFSLIFYGALLYPIWKKYKPSYALFALGTFLMPLSTWMLMSFTRYMLISFPHIILVIEYIEDKPFLKSFVWTMSIGLCWLFTIMFVNYYWVG